MERNGIYIIDLDKTMRAMETPVRPVQKTVAQGEPVLFVGTKKQAKDVIVEEARRCKMFHVTERWLGGMLTNFQTIRQSIRYLRNLERMGEARHDGEALEEGSGAPDEEPGRLEKTFEGIKDMHRLPGMVFILDTKREHLAVRECQRLGVPSIGIVDTNSDPDDVTIRSPATTTRSAPSGSTPVWSATRCLPPGQRSAARGPPAGDPAGEVATGGAWSSDYSGTRAGAESGAGLRPGVRRMRNPGGGHQATGGSMEISANTVRMLRDRTGAGMMDCKKALAESAGDVEKAIEYLRKVGIASAAKRSHRRGVQGRIECYLHPGTRSGCSSRSTARPTRGQDGRLKNFCHEVAMHIAATRPLAVSAEDLDAAVVAKEQEILLEQVRNSGKPRTSGSGSSRGG